LDTLTLYVPAPSSHLNQTIDAGAAIVGEPLISDDSNRANRQAADEDWIVIYYEGNRYGSMRDFDEMVLHAADRLVTGYPTIARSWVLPDDLVAVGTVDRNTRTIVSITDEPALLAWRAG
jgi:hypothetical protein